MQFESLNADLRAWLKTSVEGGYARDALIQSMRSAGYQQGFAQQAVDLALARFGAAVAPAAVVVAESTAGVAAPTAKTSSELLAESANAIQTSDRRVDILFVLNAPRIVLFGNLLSLEECDAMVEYSSRKLQRSTVVNAKTGAYDVHPDRTSSGTHFERAENEVVARIERRISDLLGVPAENGEPIQILHYTPGAEYKAHWDYFDPAHPGNEKVLAMGGQRVATLIMYLNDVQSGGSTVFPDVGIDVLPRKGNAVYFAYTTEDGQLDRRTLHGGSPVISGEKWIATKWLRERAYVVPPGVADSQSAA